MEGLEDKEEIVFNFQVRVFSDVGLELSHFTFRSSVHALTRNS